MKKDYQNISFTPTSQKQNKKLLTKKGYGQGVWLNRLI